MTTATHNAHDTTPERVVVYPTAADKYLGPLVSWVVYTTAADNSLRSISSSL